MKPNHQWVPTIHRQSELTQLKEASKLTPRGIGFQPYATVGKC